MTPSAVLYQTVMVSYWGHDEASATTLAPGEEVRFTQYLVAFEQYSIAAFAGDDIEVGCTGAEIAVVLVGEARLVEPSAGEVFYRWSSTDPRVRFDDPASATTTATVPAIGRFPITLTAAVGAFQSSDEMSVAVQDADPPALTLSASPSSLWPPNHRMRRVEVSATLDDACDPAPTLRLVSVTANESDDTRRGGDGSTRGDICDADLGTDDRSVLLRAERQGGGSGRTYTLVYEAADASGNATQRSVEIAVAHDQGRSTSRRRP